MVTSITFDILSEPNLSAGYCFDREFFATLKEIYALYKNGYTIDYTFLSASPELSDNIYSYEVLLRRILERLNLLNNINNWSYVKDTLNILQDDRKSLEVRYSKFNKFINLFPKRAELIYTKFLVHRN